MREYITKTITIRKDLYDLLKFMKEKEKRSFSMTVEIALDYFFKMMEE